MPRTALFLAALAVTAGAAPVDARGKCAPRAEVLERLVSGFGETRQSIGLGGERQVIETFAASATGTWTIIVTLPSGLSCVIAAGRSFENLAEELPPEGEPA